MISDEGNYEETYHWDKVPYSLSYKQNILCVYAGPGAAGLSVCEVYRPWPAVGATRLTYLLFQT